MRNIYLNWVNSDLYTFIKLLLKRIESSKIATKNVESTYGQKFPPAKVYF